MTQTLTKESLPRSLAPEAEVRKYIWMEISFPRAHLFEQAVDSGVITPKALDIYLDVSQDFAKEKSKKLAKSGQNTNPDTLLKTLTPGQYFRELVGYMVERKKELRGEEDSTEFERHKSALDTFKKVYTLNREQFS